MIKRTAKNRHLGGLKARDKNLALDPDFYRKIGSAGGSAYHTSRGGFLKGSALASWAGRKGGTISRRGVAV